MNPEARQKADKRIQVPGFDSHSRVNPGLNKSLRIFAVARPVPLPQTARHLRHRSCRREGLQGRLNDPLLNWLCSQWTQLPCPLCDTLVGCLDSGAIVFEPTWGLSNAKDRPARFHM